MFSKSKLYQISKLFGTVTIVLLALTLLNCSFIAKADDPPATVQHFRITDSGGANNTITMEWDDISNELSYQIYKMDGNGTFVSYGSPLPSNTTKYTDTNITCNDFYKISYLTLAGESSRTGWIKGAPLNFSFR